MQLHETVPARVRNGRFGGTVRPFRVPTGEHQENSQHYTIMTKTESFLIWL